MEKCVYESPLMAMAEAVMGFTTRGNELQGHQYCQFWADLNNPAQGSDCLTALIAKLLAVATGEDKLYTLPDLVRKLANHDFESASDQAKLTTESMDVQQAVLGTIYFVSLFYPHEVTSEALKATIARWIKLRGRSPKTLDFVDECLRMLAAGYVETNEGIISLVEQCSNSLFADDFSIETATMGQIAPCLINTYLRNCLRQGRQTRVIFETILLFLKHSKIVQEPRLLCLFHMLRSFITTCPYVDADIIDNIIQHVKQYYLWPCPYGNVAKELLQLLSIELKSPGAAMREKFIEENPELEKGYTPTGRERSVYMIVDQSIEKCKQFQVLLQACPPEEVSISQVQMNLLANILQTSAQIDPDSLCLEFCTREDTATFYHTAIEILKQAITMEEGDAVAFRQEKLMALKEYIATRSTASKRTSVALQSQARTTSPPPLQLEFLPVNPPSEGAPSSFVTHFKYPRRSTMDTLLYIIKQYPQSAETAPHSVVKVGIVGDDQTLHAVVGSYVAIKASKPRLLDNLTFQFYLIPLAAEEGRSTLSTFLAKRDGWYGRHVMCTTSCILKLYPSISPSEPKVDTRPKKNTWTASDTSSASMQLIARNFSGMAPTDLALALETGQQALRVPLKPPSPSLLLRTELQNYIREAHNRLEMNIYQCECWSADGIACTIPFTLRVTLGIQAAAKLYMMANGITERLSVEELQSKAKAFKYAPINLGIKFIQMNVFGAPRQGPPMEFRAYNEIIVANIPVRGDRFIAPNPTKNWLEMYTQEADAKKRKARADEHTYHVSTLEVEAKDIKKETFHVVIDDVVYGPFAKIKITPCLSSKEPMVCHTLPIMTYFPIVL